MLNKCNNIIRQNLVYTIFEMLATILQVTCKKKDYYVA